MGSINSEKILILESLLSEIPTLKAEIEITRDVLQFLDINVGKRCRNLTKLIMSHDFNHLEELSGKISEDYNALLRDINKAVGKINSLEDAKANASKTLDVPTDDDYTKRKSFKFLDQKRLSQNLIILMNMVEDFRDENKRLKIRNQLLTHQILGIVRALLAQVRDGAVTVFDESETGSADETESVALDEVLEQFTALRMNINQANYMFEETKSLSHEILGPHDASFIIDGSETRILTMNDWRNSIAKLRAHQDEMAVAEKRLKAIKLAHSKK